MYKNVLPSFEWSTIRYCKRDSSVTRPSRLMTLTTRPFRSLNATTLGGHVLVGSFNVFITPISKAHNIEWQSRWISTTDCKDWQFPSSCRDQHGNGVKVASHAPTLFSNEVLARVTGVEFLNLGTAINRFCSALNWALVAIEFLASYLPDFLNKAFVVGHGQL